MKTLEQKKVSEPKKQMGRFANLEELIEYKMQKAEKLLRKAKVLVD